MIPYEQLCEALAQQQAGIDRVSASPPLAVAERYGDATAIDEPSALTLGDEDEAQHGSPEIARHPYGQEEPTVVSLDSGRSWSDDDDVAGKA